MENYYVYLLLDPRYKGEWVYKDFIFKYKPFYVGKGKGDRATSHFRKSALKRNCLKNSIIKSIKNDNLEPIVLKYKSKLNENSSFELEIDIIKHFGRIDENKGILGNHTNGGEGHSGYNKPKLKGRKKVYQYTLQGNFKKEWSSISEISEVLNVSGGNISTAIKRDGTFIDSIWSYKFEGHKIPKRVKYKMPCKFNTIKQLDGNTVVNIFKNIQEIKEKLNLSIAPIYKCLNGKQKKAHGYKWSQKS